MPDLSPDGGTSSSTAPSPALSTTLSDSSSLTEVGVQLQQQQQQQAIPQIMPQQQQQQLQLPLTQQLPTQQIQVVRTNQHHDHLVTQQLKATVQLIEGTINNNNNINNQNNTTTFNIDNTANNNINNNINNNNNQLITNKIEEHDYNNHDTEHKIHKPSSSCSSLIGVDNNNIPQFSPQIQINKFKTITNMQNNNVVEMLNGSETSSMVVDKSILLSDKAPTPFTSSSSTTQDTVDSSMKMSTDSDPITVVKSNQSLTTSSTVNKSANLSVANNIANAFINLSTFNSPTVGAVNNNNNNNSSSSGSSPSGSGTTSNTKNVNVIVTQPISQHFVKTLSFATSRGGIFVPNVIATNLSPQFTVHHHQYGIHGASGPAPNVTVNPNGNFNSNSSAVVRPGTSNHFRLLFQQSPNINFNIVGNQNACASASATGTNQSPILEASLQTLSKVTQGKIISNSKINTTNRIIPSTVINSKTTNAPALVPTQPITKLNASSDSCSPLVSSVTSPKSTGEQASNDQHIRVLTPSEIMRTLPSLPPQDHNICFNSTNVIITDKSNIVVDNNNKILVKASTTSQQCSSAQTVSQSQPLSASNNSPLITNNTIINTNLFCNSSTNSSPITTTTSDTFISSNITNSTTSSSVLAQQMVRGYKTYTKKYTYFSLFHEFFLFVLLNLEFFLLITFYNKIIFITLMYIVFMILH